MAIKPSAIYLPIVFQNFTVRSLPSSVNRFNWVHSHFTFSQIFLTVKHIAVHVESHSITVWTTWNSEVKKMNGLKLQTSSKKNSMRDLFRLDIFTIFLYDNRLYIADFSMTALLPWRDWIQLVYKTISDSYKLDIYWYSGNIITLKLEFLISTGKFNKACTILMEILFYFYIAHSWKISLR